MHWLLVETDSKEPTDADRLAVQYSVLVESLGRPAARSQWGLDSNVTVLRYVVSLLAVRVRASAVELPTCSAGELCRRNLISPADASHNLG